jgi:hypothetical protein
MLKGDKSKSKADPEDGITPITNLLLETKLLMECKCLKWIPKRPKRETNNDSPVS